MVNMNKETLEAIIEDLKAGRTPTITTADVPAFSEEATAGNDHLSPTDLDIIAQSLAEADIPTFERALKAVEEGELAWLGFKVVYDPAVAQAKSGIGFTKDYGEVGSADGEPLVFFCNDAKEIVSSREPSKRDLFQMKDVTRGPSMHNEQFEGLTWASVALFDPIRVWLLGASDVAVELVPLARKVGFDVLAVDYDTAYLNADRFPDAHRILLDGEGFDALFDLHAKPEDYVCVLTRGHMHDPDGCIWASREGVHYIGMMGCKGKNDGIHDLVIEGGVTEEQWNAIKRPIGLKFGAKTPAELAIAIVAELIDVRYQQRYPEDARKKHEDSLGR